MKCTFDLYRCSATEWSKLPYLEALHFRVIKAREAMSHYRLVRPVTDDSIAKYNDSEDAVKWNIKFIEEIKKDNK